MGAVDVAAHALILGERDWRAALDERGDTESVLYEQVLQRAVDLLHERDKRLATMIANGVNGARGVDGRRSGVNTGGRAPA